jgi:hypothetical protein
MMDKRSESQFPDINKVDHGDMPEGFGTMTPETENEIAEAEERKRTAIPYLSRNAEDILNSKRSRGERL